MPDLGDKLYPAVHQHYVPEFYMKRFASDPRALKVRTLAHRHRFIIEEDRAIESTCASPRIYGQRETDVTQLEQVLQRTGAWTLDVAGRPAPLSQKDARDVFRAVNHFSIRTPLSKRYFQSFADRGIDLSPLGLNVNDAFEKAAIAFEEWDRMFHLVCVRILHTEEDLLTSAFPASSFDANMDIDGIPFPQHVTMALDRRVLAHLMVASFDPNDEVKQKFWVGPAEDQIVIRHNIEQIGRFMKYEDVEFLIHTGPSSTPLLGRSIALLGWAPTVLQNGQTRYERVPETA